VCDEWDWTAEKNIAALIGTGAYRRTGNHNAPRVAESRGRKQLV
jgi:hypothetical protein